MTITEPAESHPVDCSSLFDKAIGETGTKPLGKAVSSTVDITRVSRTPSETTGGRFPRRSTSTAARGWRSPNGDKTRCQLRSFPHRQPGRLPQRTRTAADSVPNFLDSMNDDIVQAAKAAAELEPAVEAFGEATGAFEPIREMTAWLADIVRYRRLPHQAALLQRAAEKIKASGLPAHAVPDKTLRTIPRRRTNRGR